MRTRKREKVGKRDRENLQDLILTVIFTFEQAVVLSATAGTDMLRNKRRTSLTSSLPRATVPTKARARAKAREKGVDKQGLLRRGCSSGIRIAACSIP